MVKPLVNVMVGNGMQSEGAGSEGSEGRQAAKAVTARKKEVKNGQRWSTQLGWLIMRNMRNGNQKARIKSAIAMSNAMFRTPQPRPQPRNPATPHATRATFAERDDQAEWTTSPTPFTL